MLHGRNRNKFGVAPREDRTWQGRIYASKAEMVYAQYLQLLKDAGEIADFAEQPTVELGIPENKYRPDFYVTPGGPDQPYYVDVKGHETAAFKKNKRLWKRYGACALVIVKRRRGRFFVIESIHPKEQP